MPSSWNVYYVIFLSALLALGIPATLGLISSLVSPPAPKKKLHQEVLDEVALVNETTLGKRINARFFLGVNSALLLISLMLILVPCAGMLRSGDQPVGLLRAMVAIVSIACFAALGLLYAAKKGDLSWLGTFQRDAGKGCGGERVDE